MTQGYFKATLPDGRVVIAYVAGHYETDTGAMIIDADRHIWEDTRAALTHREINQEIDGYYLHEYVIEKGEFTHEDWL